jgi:hypothetical protein
MVCSDALMISNVQGPGSSNSADRIENVEDDAYHQMERHSLSAAKADAGIITSVPLERQKQKNIEGLRRDSLFPPYMAFSRTEYPPLPC